MSEGSFTSMHGWNTIWLSMSDTTPPLEIPKPRESVVSQNKLILVE
jgi:hypothetical protein